jgi:acyl transferase domain-containing protein
MLAICPVFPILSRRIPSRLKKGGRTNENPLFLGSVKANTGYSEPASCMASLIKVLLIMQKT